MNLRVFFILAAAGLPFTASAGFHFMQVQQVIGGIEGNTNAQAIQLRMRSGSQNLVSNSKVWAWDASGANRVLLLDITNNVSSSTAGSTVLLASADFITAMNSLGGTTFSPDFTLTNVIPSSYLNAGRITFEDNSGSTGAAGTIYWSLSWGGSAYTGSNAGSVTNDADGNFGPSFGLALPTSTFQALSFTGTSAALSTSNQAQYALSGNPATVTKNNGTNFVVVPEPGTIGLLAGGALLLGGGAFARRSRRVK